MWVGDDRCVGAAEEGDTMSKAAAIKLLERCFTASDMIIPELIRDAIKELEEDSTEGEFAFRA